MRNAIWSAQITKIGIEKSFMVPESTQITLILLIDFFFILLA